MSDAFNELEIGKWYGIDSKEFEQLSEGETVIIAPVNIARGITHGKCRFSSIDISYLHSKKEKIFFATDGTYKFDEVKAWSYPLIPPVRTIVNGDLMDEDDYADLRREIRKES